MDVLFFLVLSSIYLNVYACHPKIMKINSEFLKIPEQHSANPANYQHCVFTNWNLTKEIQYTEICECTLARYWAQKC